MALADIKKEKIGRKLAEIYLGIRIGARRSVADYRQMTVKAQAAAARGFTVESNKLAIGAENSIKRAVDMPNRARAKINYAIATYGKPALEASLAVAGSTTLAEIDADLTALESYAVGLVDKRLNQAWTWDQIATDLETKVANDAEEWEFPWPPGYKDIWGQ